LQPGAREAGRKQQRAGEAEPDQEIGRPGEEAEDFRDDEEHQGAFAFAVALWSEAECGVTAACVA